MCGTTIGVINMNVKRKKIIVMDNALIDTDNKINNAFMVKYQNKVHKKDPEKAREKIYKEVVQKVKSERVEPTPKATNRKKQNKESEDVNGWDLRRKKADALKAERDAEKKLLEVRKMSGEMIPVDMVGQVITTLTKSILSMFVSFNENLASHYCDIMAGGDREYLSEINEKLDHEIQRVINESKDSAKKDVNNIIKEFADTRGVGQRL